MIFFTSDNHFGHDTAVKKFRQGFSSIVEMDDLMIKRWNERVSPDDTVYVLGDFVWPKVTTDRLLNIIHQLNGKILLVRGSHDSEEHITVMMNYGIIDLGPMHVIKRGKAHEHITLCHYPMFKWPWSHYNAKHLFGHCHGSLDDVETGKSFDVGVDSNNFYPWSMDEVLNALSLCSDNFDKLEEKHD